ncbi:MAG: hypothetical protein U9O94_06035 [Nanoarchaeota archaeon]|nr:hypothetical protein [Nanoarchaeota archaeon]
MTNIREYDINGLATEVTLGIGGNALKSVTDGIEIRNNAGDAYADFRAKDLQVVDAHFTGDVSIDGQFYGGEMIVIPDKQLEIAANTTPTTTTGDGGGFMVVTGGALAGGSAQGVPGASVTVALTNVQAATSRFANITDSVVGAKNIDLTSGETGTGVAELIAAVTGLGASWAADVLTITSDGGNITACTVNRYTGETLLFDDTADNITSSKTLNVETGEGFAIDDTVIVSASVALSVPYGGTGINTATDHGVIIGSGTGALSVTAVGVNNQVLTGVNASDPVFSYVTDLYDDGGDLVFETVEVADQVNHLRFTPSATGNVLTLEAVGTDTNIDLKLNAKGTGVVESDSGMKLSTLTFAAGATVDNIATTVTDVDDELPTCKAVANYVAANAGGVNREATVTADSVNNTFSIGSALPVPAGKIRLSKAVVKVGTAFSGNSVAGLRITDGVNILIPFGVIDTSDIVYNQKGGMCLTDIKGDTLTVEFRTANDATSAIPTAGTLEIVVENTQT